MRLGLYHEGNGVATFILSSTGSSGAGLSDISECSQKALFSTILARQPYDAPRAATSFGSLVHKFAEERSKWLLTPRTTDFLKDVRPLLVEEAQKPDNAIPLNDFRNHELLLHIAKVYHETYADLGFQTAYYRDPMGFLQPAVEMSVASLLTEDNEDHASFTLPEGTELLFWENHQWIKYPVQDIRVIYRGKIDLIYLQKDLLYVRDYKTCQREEYRYWDLKWFSNQFNGYWWLLNQIAPQLLDHTGAPLNRRPVGIELDRILFGKPTQPEELTVLRRREKSFDKLANKLADPNYKAKPAESKKLLTLQREMDKLRDALTTASAKMPEIKLDRIANTSYTEESSRTWRRNTLTIIRDFLLHHAETYYPQNRSACSTTYGPCCFLDICMTEESKQLQLLMSTLFEDRKVNE